MRIWLFTFLLALSAASQANVEAYRFDDPAREAQYQRLIAELRCLVCQNQNLADSNAELAQDLRRKTYEMVQQGQSEQEIVAYMVQRYGDFVLYRPPVKSTTLLLWVGPFVLLAIGVFVVWRVARGRKSQAATAPDGDAVVRAGRLLDDEEPRP